MLRIFLFVLCLNNLLSYGFESDTVYVSSVQELILNLGNNKVIILSNGEYDLSDVKPTDNPKHIARSLEDEFSVQFYNLQNVEFFGQESVEIIVNNSFGWVIAFHKSSEIKLENLILGHSATNVCLGRIVSFESCNGIELENLKLSGCTITGIKVYDSYDLLMKNCEVYDCTPHLNLIHIVRSIEISIEETVFRNIKGYEMIFIKNSDVINFIECEFLNNYGQSYSGFGVAFISLDRFLKIFFVKCVFMGNDFLHFTDRFHIISFKHNKFRKNEFNSPKMRDFIHSMPVWAQRLVSSCLNLLNKIKR